MVKGNYKGAIVLYKQIIESEPCDFVVLCLLAQCYELDGKGNDAVSVVKRAVEVAPENFFTLRTAARISARTGEHHLAKVYVEQALNNVPRESPESRGLVDTLPGVLFWFMRQIASLPILGNRINKGLIAGLDSDRMAREIYEWKEWAHGYLVWYEKSFGVGDGGPLH